LNTTVSFSKLAKVTIGRVRKREWPGIVIPAYDEIGLDIIRSCMRTAGMTRERYLQLLEKC